MSGYLICSRENCINEVAIGLDVCHEHAPIDIRFLYFLADNPIFNCVVWPFHRSSRTGYGSMSSANTFTQQASRYACAVANDLPVSDSLVGAHNCGNGHLGCVNPHHLRWATYTENGRDRRRHQANGEGRWAIWQPVQPVRAGLIKPPRPVEPKHYQHLAHIPDGKPKPLVEVDPELFHRLHGYA